MVNDDIMFLKKISDGEWYSINETVHSRKAFNRMVRRWLPILERRVGYRNRVFVRVKKEYRMSLGVLLGAWKDE